MADPIDERGGDTGDAASAINQRIFETSIDLILVVDRQGNFIRVSPSAQPILGYEPGEMIGCSAIGFVHPPDLDNTREEMRAARRGRVTRNFECRYVHKDGHPVTLIWTGVWSEPVQQHFFIGRDVTERRKIEAQLRQAQKMEALGNLTGGMAHDFNNLLGVIVGNLDLAGSLLAEHRQAAELVREAFEAALSGADLIRRLLAFARQQPLRPERLEPNSLVSNIVRLLRRTLGENVEISLDLAEDLWPVAADPAQLESALVNLATNARDAMPGGGRLLIATANRHLDAEYAASHVEVTIGDYALIEVTDTGTGMSQEVAERIFEPFYTTKGAGKGSGLGLSMVFGFIKQSGGHVSVYSEPGIGTTFRLYLPRALVGAPAQAGRQASRAPRGAGERVLAVEDNPALRRMVTRQLLNLGYQPIEAAGPQVALAALEAGNVDLLFTDIVMPGPIDGIALARQVLERWPSVKVVLTSGFSGVNLEEQLGPQAGRVALLGKPYRAEELAAVLRAALEG